jgi:hypothetical protein
MAALRGVAGARRPLAARSSKLVDALAVAGRITDLPPEQRPWFVPIGDAVVLHPGNRASTAITIPQADASRLLLGFVRFVADIPADTNLRIVWQRGHDELDVDGASIGLTCTPGLLIVGLTVTCDEVRKPVRIGVPFAVGRPEAPRGLLMSTVNRVDAPALIADGWSDPIIAFCWESVLELAQRVSAQAGNDAEGRPLIPGAVAAGDGTLVVVPMARHSLGGLTRGRRVP